MYCNQRGKNATTCPSNNKKITYNMHLTHKGKTATTCTFAMGCERKATNFRTNTVALCYHGVPRIDPFRDKKYFLRGKTGTFGKCCSLVWIQTLAFSQQLSSISSFNVVRRTVTRCKTVLLLVVVRTLLGSDSSS